MAIDRFSLGSKNNERVEAVTNSIKNGEELVKKMGDTVTEELDLESHQPTETEVIKQLLEEGYREVNSESRSWKLNNMEMSESINIRIIDLINEEGDFKKVYFSKNDETNQFELLEGREEEKIIKMIEQTDNVQRLESISFKD